METSGLIAFWIYVTGLLGWYAVWHYLLGFGMLKKLKLLHIPFWGAQFVFIVNMILAFFAVSHDYTTELALYPYVESNAKTVAGMSLAIAVFWVFVTKDKLLDEAHTLVKFFLWLLFWAFLMSVMGTLPLYWVPPGGHWLTSLRHIKSVPFFYSLFILASALVVFMYELAYTKRLANELPQLNLGEDANDEEATPSK
jgi:hypothetical protein